MRRNGTTSSGRQRWRCIHCRASSTGDGGNARGNAEFHAFLAWATGRMTLAQAAAMLGVSPRTFIRRIQWCWQVRPEIPRPASPCQAVEADGTYVPYGWCLLVAIDAADGTPVAFQWCDTENRAAYTRLFSGLPAPRTLVTDGGAGCAAAAADTWKGTRIQRCLVHVLRNTRADLTGRPRTDAGKDLLKLARKLVKIRNADEAAAWLNLLNDWHTRYADVIGQRTTARDDPGNPKARAGRTWWWTHARLRRAYYRFIRLQRDGTLFAFCEPAAAGVVPSTTNRLEGGVNADIKRVLDAHRGLTEEHMKRVCEWVLYMKTHDPDPGTFITTAPGETGKPPTASTGLPAGSIQEAAPGVDAYESGFGIRKGWAGRTR